MSFTTIRYSSAPENRRTSHYSENPGLIEEVDGYYDWAGRRLFLADRSPDPMTAGAYRYQTRPDLCDLAAPASDPASPYYEPPHLRHQPGDTWIIDHNRPYDPDDPGPFGSIGWRPDRRTGRHRRGELPDPIPPWEQEASAVAPSAGERTMQIPARDASASRAANDHSGRPPASGGSLPPQNPGPRRPVPAPEPQGPRPGGLPFPSQTPFPSPAPVPSSSPRRPQPWPEADCRAAEDKSGPSAHVLDEPYRFDKFREGAWDRFMIKSAELAAAHQRTRSALMREAGPVIGLWVRFARWGLAAIRGPVKRAGREAQGARTAAEQPDRGSDLAGGAAWV